MFFIITPYFFLIIKFSKFVINYNVFVNNTTQLLLNSNQFFNSYFRILHFNFLENIQQIDTEINSA